MSVRIAILSILPFIGIDTLWAQGGGADLFERASRVDRAEKQERTLDLKREKQFPGTFKVKVKEAPPQAAKVDVDMYRRQKAKLIFARRQKAIADSERILKRTRDPELRSNLELVLANLYMENYDHYRLEEQEQYNQAWKRFKGKGKKPVLDERRSKSYKNKAMTIYRKLYSKDRDHPSRDEILYFLGYLAYGEGDEKGALVFFNELMSRYPRSRLTPEAELKVGDYYFKSDIDKALVFYMRLAKRNHALSIYARYKMAWCYFNQKKFDASIDSFKSVVAQSLEEKGKRGAFDLTSEALNDLVLAFAEANRPDEARAYFYKVGGEQYYIDLLQKLGDIYFTQGKLQESVKLFRELIGLKPNHIKAPSWHQNIIEAFKTMGRTNDSLQAMEDYAVKFQKGTEWARANYERPDDVEEAINAGEFGLRKTTKEAHFLAQKSHERNDYIEATRLYQIYLKYYASNENAYEMNFYYAEALYQIREYKLAGTFYGKVAKAGEKKKFYVDATYGGIVAFIAEMEKGEKLKPAKKETKADLKLVPLESFHEEFIELVDLFVKDKPNDSRAVDLMFRSGFLCYDKNHYDCAEKRFTWIIKTHPQSKKAEYAADLLLHYLNVEEKYNLLADRAESYLKIEKLGDAKYKGELRALISKSRFKSVELVEKSGNHSQAATAYAKLGMSDPDPNVADKALYKASENFLKMNDDENALKYYSILIKRFPRSTLAPSSTLWIAGYHRDRLQLLKAAKALEQYIEMAPKSDKELANARYDVAVFYETLQMYPEALKAYQSYAMAEAAKNDAAEAYQRGCEMMFRLKRNADAIRCYENSKKLWPKRGLDALLADGAIMEIFRKTRNDRGQDAQRKRILSAYSRSVDSAPSSGKIVVAQALFEEGQETFERFEAVKLDTYKVALLQKKIKDKLALLKAVEKTYTNVLKTGVGEWGVPALFKIGAAYQSLAEGLLNAPKPPGLTPEEIAVYEEQLQGPAIELDEKGRAFFETAYQTIKKVGIYNDWSKRIYAKLNAVDSIQYPIQFETGLQPLYMSEFVKD